MRDRADSRRTATERAELQRLIGEARLLAQYVEENLRTLRERLPPEEAFGFQHDLDHMRARLDDAAAAAAAPVADAPTQARSADLHTQARTQTKASEAVTAADVAALIHQLRSKFRRTLTRLRRQQPTDTSAPAADGRQS